MRIERINENKLKVTISIDDLLERNIDIESLNYNSPATQKLFWDMMEQAEIQYGFCASDSQICIEAAPDSDEGFVIIITKLDEGGEFESIQKYIKNKFKKTDLKSKKDSPEIYSSLLIYYFDSFEDLRLLSKRIMRIYAGESTLYKLSNTYYLLLTKGSPLGNNNAPIEPILSEFGNRVTNAGFYLGYLSEYAKKIIEYNAIETLYDYF